MADITGTQFDDILSGDPEGPSDDVIRTGDGVDFVFGGEGADTIFGGLGDDVLRGEAGDDIIEGNLGVNRMEGGFGDDTLISSRTTGDGFDDFLSGLGDIVPPSNAFLESGIDGDFGNVNFGDPLLFVDILEGGTGADTFVVREGGQAAITDFSLVQDDRILLDGSDNIQIIEDAANRMIVFEGDTTSLTVVANPADFDSIAEVVDFF